MEGTSLEESGWFQRERSFKLPVLCRGMVSFGQRRIFGTAEKEHPSPPLPSPAVGEVLKLDSIAVSVFADILIELPCLNTRTAVKKILRAFKTF